MQQCGQYRAENGRAICLLFLLNTKGVETEARIAWWVGRALARTGLASQSI